MHDEEWRPVSSWPNYEASSLGRVRNAGTGRVLTPHLDRDDRLTVWLSANGTERRRRVHQLVAEAFHGPRPEHLVTRHLNDDRQDNRPENLAYGTKLDNWQDALRNGRLSRLSTRQEVCRRGHARVALNMTSIGSCVACDRARHAVAAGHSFARLSSDVQVVSDWYFAELMGLPGAPLRPAPSTKKVNPT